MTMDEIEALIARLDKRAKANAFFADKTESVRGGTAYAVNATDYTEAVTALRQLLSEREWRPIESVITNKEIVALCHGYYDGKHPIVLRWFKYNGVEAWRDWDADARLPYLWFDIPAPPMSQLEERAPASEETSQLGESLPDTNGNPS